MIHKQEEKENKPLNEFVDFINLKNGIIRNKAGSGKGKPVNLNQTLFEISTLALVLGCVPNIACSLRGYELTVYGKTKKIILR